MAPRPFIPVPDTIEAELTFQLGSVFMTNRFFYSNVFPGFSSGDDLALAGWLGTWCINFYLPVLADDVQFLHSRARFLTSATDPWARFDYTGYFGSWGDVAMSANVTLRVRGKRQVYDTRQRPYVCVPAPPRNTVVENTFTPAYRSAVVDALVEVYEPTFLGGTEWVWVSFRQANAWRAAGVPRLWPALQPMPEVAPRRRRLRNVTFYS